MSTQLKLIDIDPETIFELYNVTDIIEIHKKLQDEIEKKKEDLRTMVGERYRDLILAADTIGEMKQTSTKVGEHIQSIIDSCVSLNDQQLIGFKTIEPRFQNINLNSEKNHVYSIVIQIKLLTVMPELIWSAIDDEDYFIATQLFIFSRHISTGLQLKQNDEILKNLPIAKKQWDILSSFFVTIKRSCQKTLERENLSYDIATKCLASLILLENCNVQKIFNIFIQYRTKSYVNCLCDDRNHPKLKDKILMSLKILNETILLISHCFVDGELFKLLSTLTVKEARTTISLVEAELEPEILVYLPDIITRFRPIFNFGELKEDAIKSTMHSWLKSIEDVSKNQLKMIIDLITSVKTIHDIRLKALNEEKYVNWSSICSSLHLPANLNFYKYCYQPLILNCVKSIIKNSWKMLLNHTKRDIERLLENNEKNLKQFKKYIWSEEDTDIPKSLKDALNQSKQSHKLLMKTKGYIPLIVEVCNTMDERLDILYSDFNLYLNNDETDVVNGFRKLAEATQEEIEIVQYFKDASRDGITDLITEIKQIDHRNTIANIILIARILQAISELCPNLKSCLSFTLKSSEKLPETDYWLKICSLLEDESVIYWRIWIEKFLDENNRRNQLENELNLNLLLKEFPNWENQQVEEKDDSDNVIKSNIRIPSQPSYLLQKYLYHWCTELNKLCPNTLPKHIINLLTESLLQNLYNYYNNLLTSTVSSDFLKTNQNISLQYYFDLKFLNLLLIARDNKSLIAQYTSLTNQFKTFIDPFDFELFFKYIQQNIKKSAIRMQHQLGCLILNNEQLAVLLSGANLSQTGFGCVEKSSQQQVYDREPNILALSSTGNTTTWFPLLPIVSSTMGNDKNDGPAAAPRKSENIEKSHQSAHKAKKSSTTDSMKNSLSSSALQAATSNVKSSAASFFGAMSHEWFRSS